MALSFNAPVDIGNRALQFCGVTRMGTSGFLEDSKNASAIAFVYDKLRRAELRRNIWRFSIKEALLRGVTTTTAALGVTLWSSGTTYAFGAMVSDATGSIWSSLVDGNLNNTPGASPQWELYFGPLVADVYDSTLSYTAGEVVYVTAGDGQATVYRSLANSNTDNPATANAYSATTTYRLGQVVTYSSVTYQSLINFNTGNQPSLAPALWAVGTTYASGAHVGASDGFIYSSNTNGNVGNDPLLDAVHWTSTGVLNPWTTVITNGSGSYNWRVISATLSPLPIIYPITAGPISQATTRNVFWLPANFLRHAPEDPKAGSATLLGAPTNLVYDDWKFESKYIVSQEAGPLRLRFAADIVDVTQMDEMFCEGLAARIAMAAVQELTQSTAKLSDISQQYKVFMGEARLVNALDIGPIEPPLDDLIATRA